MKAKQAKRNKQWKAKQRKRQEKLKEENEGQKKPKFQTKQEEWEAEQDGSIWNDHENGDNHDDHENENINGYPGPEANGYDEGYDDDRSSKKKKKSGGFQSMGLSYPVLKGILKKGYKVPTPIQRKTIPVILEGRDVVAMARTGSGKTAAFLIPLFEKLQYNKTATIGQQVKFPRALILSPTRELATQTVKFFRELGRYVDLKVVSVLGGDSMEGQFAALMEKPDVVVATPGRFMHLCVEMEMKLDGVQYVVFDEADRLFEMGFGEQITEICKRLADDRQTVLFSATLPRVLVDFTKAGLHDPTLIRLDVDTKLPEQLKLVHIACRTEDKLPVLLYLLKNEVQEQHQTIVFVATKHHVELLHAILDDANISNSYIYSSLDASARKISLGKFRNGKANVMIVTDIAARGIDIPILDNVINYHFPAKPKLFMHRVGRVARAGRSGTAISIVAPDEVSSLLDLHLFLGKPIKFDDSPGKENDGSVAFGRVPQDILDTEQSFLANLLDVKTELESLFKVARNGYAQYLKSRPPASAESNKRAKTVDYSKLPFHKIFKTVMKEDPMVEFVSQIHNYRPKSTIFEIGPKAGSTVHQIMKTKRIKDQEFVEKHRTGKVTQPTSVIEMESAKKDDENFISYLPKDYHTETGLSVASAFDRQVQDSVMDITGDDSEALKNQRSLQKWDRKRKKFVSAGKDLPNQKKIKTESGTWISASYKSDRFKSWQEKTKVAQQMEDDYDSGGEEGGDSFARKGVDPSNRKPAFSKRLVKAGKNAAASKFPGNVQKGKRFKSEIKRPEQILKARKVKEAKQKKFGGKKKAGPGGKGGKSMGGFSKGGGRGNKIGSGRKMK